MSKARLVGVVLLSIGFAIAAANIAASGWLVAIPLVTVGTFLALTGFVLIVLAGEGNERTSN